MAREPRMPMGMSRCGVLGFLRGGGDGVEADEGEEDDAGAAEDSAPAVTEDAFVAGHAGGNHEGRVVGGVDELPADGDEADDDGHLDEDDDGVDAGRLLGALDEEQR